VHVNLFDRGKCYSLGFGQSQLEVGIDVLPLFLGLLEPFECFSLPSHDILLGRVQSGKKLFMVLAVHVNGLLHFM
jgi:hypothetical protein